MTIYDLPPIKKGMWRVEFINQGAVVMVILNAHEAIQTWDQAREISIAQYLQFKPDAVWSRISVHFTSDLTLQH